MQLDIFEDSRDVMLRNDALQALLRRDVDAARAARQVLVQEYPADPTLAPLAVLVEALQQSNVFAPFPGLDTLCQARASLEAEVEPAARQLLGDAATPWLAPLWRSAALRAAKLPFEREHADDHAAALWLRANDASAAEQAVRGIESWRRIPAPLGWMAHARHAMHGLDEAWPLLAELAWLAPARFAALTRVLADPALDKLLRQFDAEFEGNGGTADLAWFPAWVLTRKSGLARLLSQAQAQNNGAPERAMRLLVEIVGLERQGRQHELIDKRRSLRSLNAGLHAAYLRDR